MLHLCKSWIFSVLKIQYEGGILDRLHSCKVVYADVFLSPVQRWHNRQIAPVQNISGIIRIPSYKADFCMDSAFPKEDKFNNFCK